MLQIPPDLSPFFSTPMILFFYLPCFAKLTPSLPFFQPPSLASRLPPPSLCFPCLCPFLNPLFSSLYCLLFPHFSLISPVTSLLPPTPFPQPPPLFFTLYSCFPLIPPSLQFSQHVQECILRRGDGGCCPRSVRDRFSLSVIVQKRQPTDVVDSLSFSLIFAWKQNNSRRNLLQIHYVTESSYFRYSRCPENQELSVLYPCSLLVFISSLPQCVSCCSRRTSNALFF